jgi:catalase
LKSQLASPGDSTKDASIPWPKSNEVVELGVLTIDKTVPDSLEAQKKLLFLPGQLVEGIEPSDDPLIGVRDGAYAVFRAAIRESNILQTERSQALVVVGGRFRR